MSVKNIRKRAVSTFWNVIYLKHIRKKISISGISSLNFTNKYYLFVLANIQRSTEKIRVIVIPSCLNLPLNLWTLLYEYTKSYLIYDYNLQLINES